MARLGRARTRSPLITKAVQAAAPSAPGRVINWANALTTGLTDFLLVEADDGTMRNIADGARPGSLMNGAAYTASPSPACPGHSKAITFSGAGIVRVNQTDIVEPCTIIFVHLLRDLLTAPIVFRHINSALTYNVVGMFRYGGGSGAVGIEVGWTGSGYDAEEQFGAVYEDEWVFQGCKFPGDGSTAPRAFIGAMTDANLQWHAWLAHTSAGGAGQYLYAPYDIGSNPFDGMGAAIIRFNTFKSDADIEAWFDEAKADYPTTLITGGAGGRRRRLICGAAA